MDTSADERRAVRSPLLVKGSPVPSEVLVKRIALVVVAVGLFAVGCKSKPEAAPDPAPSVAAAPPPVASASAPAPSASVAPLGKMAHCPSTVAGAKTAIADSPD